MRSSIPPYLRSLWNLTAPVHDLGASSSGQPFVSPLGMHLPLMAPPGSDDRWFEAAAAHAAAHLVFSGHRFDPARFGPVAQAVLGVLEDARVEWLACRELPGLRRLWLGFHATTMSPMPGFEELLARLARSLLDPRWADPHPWVIKGRTMFFLDASCDSLAMPQASSLPQAASLLGNDIGQMRMQFNPRLYRLAPDYRDDNSYLWELDPTCPTRADATHDFSSGGRGAVSASEAQQSLPVQQYRYPEWDWSIPTYRRNWCAVLESMAPGHPALVAPDSPVLHAREVALPGPRMRRTRQFDGDEFDLDALVQTWAARRSGQIAEPRVHLRYLREPVASATLLLIDASASSAESYQGGSVSILWAARTAALRCALAIERAGGACAIHAFCSDGRHAVHYERVKDFNQPLDAAALARLMGIESRLSTRLGAALRHATHIVGSIAYVTRRVLLLTDGQPRDIDIHDDRYLLEDARQAVRAATRRSVMVQCLLLDRRALVPLQRMFGREQVQYLSTLEALPAALTGLVLNARH